MYVFIYVCIQLITAFLIEEAGARVRLSVPRLSASSFAEDDHNDIMIIITVYNSDTIINDINHNHNC